MAQVPVEGEWVPGCEATATEHFDYQNLTFGSAWTHLFSTVLLSGSDDLGGSGQSYIRTYLPSAAGIRCAELYFDCADQKFKLSVGGVAVAASAPRTLLAGTRVYFAVRQSIAAPYLLRLSISDGYGVEHVQGTVSLPLVGLGGSIRSGNNAGNSVAAQVYLEDVWYGSCALNDAEVDEAFSGPSLKP